MKIVQLLVLLIALFVLTGCASSRVHFEEPVGARLYLDPSDTKAGGTAHAFPVALDLPQTDNPVTFNSNVGGKPIRISLPDGTKLKGFLYVYKLDMDQVEKLAEVTFRLTDEQITKLKNGNAVLVSGYSPRERPVYKINLGLDR